MRMAKVFKSGNSQAIRIPREFQFVVDEVEMFKRNNELVIREKPKNLGGAFKLLAAFSEDFFKEGRDDSAPQKRENL